MGYNVHPSRPGLVRNHCRTNRPIPAKSPRNARYERTGLKCPLCLEIGVVVVVDAPVWAGVGMVVVGFCVVVVTGFAVVAVRGRAVVDDDAAGAVVVVLKMVVEVVGRRVVEVVTGSWEWAGGAPASASAAPAASAMATSAAVPA